MPALDGRKFLWETFASHYVEIVKNRAYNESKNFTKEESDSAKYTIHALLEKLIILLHPIIPQITSVIAKEMSIDLDEVEFPEGKNGGEDLNDVAKIEEFNSMVWKAKREKNISLKESISGIEVPEELKAFESDLKACHSLL